MDITENKKSTLSGDKKFLVPKTPKTLFIAEKPSVAIQIASALGINSKERKDGYIETDNAIVTWCVGHLVRMSYPEQYSESYKEWNLSTLPFVPNYNKGEYKYEPNESVKKQLEIVTKLYHRNDIEKLYIFPDDAQEGFYLQALVLEFAKINPNIEIMCCLPNSQTEEEIIRSYNEAISWNSQRPQLLSKAGRQRAIEDYLIGMNYSRALTCKYESVLKEYIGEYTKGTIAVGRVMSCVLGMIVQREREIANFIPIPYYKVNASFNGLNAEWVYDDKSNVLEHLLYERKGFKEKEQAEKFIASLDNLQIENIEEKTEKKTAPLLYSLTELEADASKIYKFSPSKTLAIAQKLYEGKLTTYPRTDSRYLTNSVAKELGIYLKSIGEGLTKYREVVDEILSSGTHQTIYRTKYVDDNKVADHYAIIPTGKGFEGYEKLSEDEKKIYDLILKRFLSIFLPCAEYATITIDASSNNEKFRIKKKLLVKKGFLELFEQEEENTEKQTIFAELKSLQKGKVYDTTYNIIDTQTSPPKRYTSATLVLAMDNAGNLIEDDLLRETLNESKGIGTTATRAGIIDKLIEKNKYISINNKSQTVAPTYKGELVYDILYRTIPTILNPAFSASWTMGLKQIETGQLNDSLYFDKVAQEVVKICNSIIEKDLTHQLKKDFSITQERYKKEADKLEEVLLCPVCKKNIKVHEKCFICEDYGKEAEKCHFFLNKEISGKTLTDEQCRKLIKEKKLPIMTGFKKKDGTKFSAPLYIEETGKITFDIGVRKMTDCKCSICSMPIDNSNYSWDCTNCGIKVPKVVRGKLLSDNNIKQIMSGTGTDFLEFNKKGEDGKYSAKNGKYKAKIVLNTVEKKIEFKMRSGEIKNCNCPVCKNILEYVPFGFKCTSCDYVLFNKIFGKTLSDNQMMKLLNGEVLPKTKYITKDDKEFETTLYLDNNGKIAFGQKEISSNITCPYCKNYMVIKGNLIHCAHCHAKAPYKFGGRTLTEEHIQSIIVNGRTGLVHGFKSKNDKKFSAIIVKKIDGSYGFEFIGKK